MWRVRDRATFEALARARRYRRGPLSMRFVPGDPGTPTRVAFALGRNVGSAVRRNRARRRLRAAIERHGADLAPGAYLFGGGPSVVTAPFTILEDAVGALAELAREDVR